MMTHFFFTGPAAATAPAAATEPAAATAPAAATVTVLRNFNMHVLK